MRTTPIAHISDKKALTITTRTCNPTSRACNMASRYHTGMSRLQKFLSRCGVPYMAHFTTNRNTNDSSTTIHIHWKINLKGN